MYQTGAQPGGQGGPGPSPRNFSKVQKRYRKIRGFQWKRKKFSLVRFGRSRSHIIKYFLCKFSLFSSIFHGFSFVLCVKIAKITARSLCSLVKGEIYIYSLLIFSFYIEFTIFQLFKQENFKINLKVVKKQKETQKKLYI